MSIEETNRLGGGGGGVALVGFFFPSESFESYVGRRGGIFSLQRPIE